ETHPKHADKPPFGKHLHVAVVGVLGTQQIHLGVALLHVAAESARPPADQRPFLKLRPRILPEKDAGPNTRARVGVDLAKRQESIPQYRAGYYHGSDENGTGRRNRPGFFPLPKCKWQHGYKTEPRIAARGCDKR